MFHQQRPFAVVEGYRADELVIAVPGKTVASNLDDNAGPPLDPPQEPNSSLEGTTWTGMSAEAGEFTIEFLKDNKIRYTIKTGAVGGTWKQVGNFVQFTIGNGYSVLEGNLENGLIKVNGSNQEGLKWSWTLLPKTR